VLVKALKTVRETIDAEVTFIGAGSQRDIKALENLVETLELTDYIQILPQVSYNTIPLYYRDADLIVIPSRSESFGLVALENMALGNMVIASNVGGLSGLIEHEKTGLLFEPNDVTGLTAMIKLAHDSPELRARIRETGIKKAYEYEICWRAKTIEEQYTKLVRAFREKHQYDNK
jgi:D-inositol-3-phosphate glycosyltransferase